MGTGNTVQRNCGGKNRQDHSRIVDGRNVAPRNCFKTAQDANGDAQG
jgi:hypothetical protein